MQKRTLLKGFLRDQGGAVTVDWVGVTAGILLLGIIIVYSVFSVGVQPAVTSISDNLEAFSPPAKPTAPSF
ncbi:MAG: pilus assembly protein [Pikeienuella sp.]